MQKVAAYLLERQDNMERAEARSAEANKIREEVWKWLRSKGASLDVRAGDYRSEDGSHATFTSDQAEDGPRSWSIIKLDEVTAYGRKFSASVSVTTTANLVAVYASLEVGSDAALIMPVDVDPKCPKIVRTLLGLPGKWYHGASHLMRRQRVEGFEQGDSLAAEIENPARTIPIIIVTEEAGEFVLPLLDDKLAHDLAGLANVVVLDDDGTWALTDRLGRGFSCYAGAVRVYWPRLTRGDDPFRHPLWTANRLRSMNDDLSQTRDRFRRQLRGLLMHTSALSVVRPREIDEIRNVSSLRFYAEMKARASSLADYQSIADSYANENDRLRESIKTLEESEDKLKMRVASLGAKLSVMESRLKAVVGQGDSVNLDIAPDADLDTVKEVAPPEDGEIRFYKKKHSTPNRDVMISVADCGCNNWQRATSADKAKKGIIRFEGDRSDWKTLQHCGSCQGGGMWRVRW